MRSEVTPEQIEQYQRDGFIVIEDFLTRTELESWRANVTEAIDARLHTKPGEGQHKLHNVSDDEDDYYSQVFLQCLKLLETHDGVKELLLDPRLGKLAATLAGIDGIRIWHDQALFKQPYGNPTGWHLDNPYWSFSSRDAISIWIALDDATLSNGCLYYLPGTHKTAHYDTSGIGQNIGDLMKKYPEWLSIESVATPCSAGSAVLHNGLTAHGAGANMTNRPRRAMTCAYMPEGSTFNGVQNVLPKAYFESLKIGDLLDDENINPLVWSRKT